MNVFAQCLYSCCGHLCAHNPISRARASICRPPRTISPNPKWSRESSSANRARFVCLVHDLIPIQFPNMQDQAGPNCIAAGWTRWGVTQTR